MLNGFSPCILVLIRVSAGSDTFSLGGSGVEREMEKGLVFCANTVVARSISSMCNNILTTQRY